MEVGRYVGIYPFQLLAILRCLGGDIKTDAPLTLQARPKDSPVNGYKNVSSRHSSCAVLGLVCGNQICFPLALPANPGKRGR